MSTSEPTAGPAAGPADEDDKPQKAPQKRSSKACETCRVRRIRCVGPPPCDPCRSAGLGSSCTVRQKARPKRAPSAKLFMRANPSADAHPLERRESLLTATSASPTNGFVDKRNPLDEAEAALAVWCAEKGVSFSHLVFKVDTRLGGLPPTPLPLPPLLTEFEDVLMEQLLVSQGEQEPFDHREGDDRTLLRSLYGRYRAVPNSLTEDQRALVYAALCTSRFNQIRTSVNEGTPLTTMDTPREDVTYYRMAYNSLANWSRPSLVAVWALFYLIPFTIGMGGPAETKDLLQQMAWQIKELGLHRKMTASLYQPHDQVGALFSAFFYTEMFRASLMDLSPVLPFSDIDVDPTPPATMFPECLTRTSYFTAKFLADFTDPMMDTTNMSYIAGIEALWMPYLRELRQDHFPTTPRAKIGWAQFRYNWLRILLYLPHIGHPQLSPLAYSSITRAVQQILYTYMDLVSYQQLNPSWPQVQRLVICGQLLILCHNAGELHVREAETLFQLILDLLVRHQDTWPCCADLIVGFKSAAAAFDISVGPELSMPLMMAEPISMPPQPDIPFQGFPFEFSFDFDIGTLAMAPEDANLLGRA